MLDRKGEGSSPPTHRIAEAQRRRKKVRVEKGRRERKELRATLQDEKFKEKEECILNETESKCYTDDKGVRRRKTKRLNREKKKKYNKE